MLLSFNHYFKELFAEKRRIILTILAIAWGTFSITTMLAIGEGLRITFNKAASNSGKNLITVTGGATSKAYRGIPAYRTIYLTREDVKAIVKSSHNIKQVSKVYSFSKRVRLGSEHLGCDIRAVNSHYDQMHEITVEKGGRFISPLDMKDRRAVIVLGSETAKVLREKTHIQQLMGKTIYLDTQGFLVIGVMQSKPQIAGSSEPDIFLNWIPAATYELYNNPAYINSLSVNYKNMSDLSTLKKAMIKAVAFVHGVDPQDSNIVQFTELAKRQEKINSFFLGMEIFLGVIGLLTLIIAAIGIANVMFASVKRSTHDIGVRLAIGARTYQILLHYMIEAVAATFLGGILGIFATAIIVFCFRWIPMKGRLIEVIGRPEPVLSWQVFLIVILTLGVVGLLAGLLPALMASRVDPCEALRDE